jgi:hypothetical protein
VQCQDVSEDQEAGTAKWNQLGANQPYFGLTDPAPTRDRASEADPPLATAPHIEAPCAVLNKLAAIAEGEIVIAIVFWE